MLLSRSSNESLLRKKNTGGPGDMYADDEDSEEDDMDREDYKTPASEKLKLESMSVFYSKGLYPTSLGLVQSDNE
jgi:hypothetical protein